MITRWTDNPVEILGYMKYIIQINFTCVIFPFSIRPLENLK